eukprot:GHVU01213665.1.p1 GENE.GHVU01213665.1~~GHVU01213665.1.p1  ORF type:complete len:187 (+),score=21.90 GHVU01213665.1:627-1187(+)
MTSAQKGLNNTIDIGQIKEKEGGGRIFQKTLEQGFSGEMTWRASITTRIIINANTQTSKYQKEPLEIVLKLGKVCLTKVEPEISWTQQSGLTCGTSTQLITDDFDDFPICEEVYTPNPLKSQDLSESTNDTPKTSYLEKHTEVLGDSEESTLVLENQTISNKKSGRRGASQATSESAKKLKRETNP